MLPGRKLRFRFAGRDADRADMVARVSVDFAVRAIAVGKFFGLPAAADPGGLASSNFDFVAVWIVLGVDHGNSL